MNKYLVGVITGVLVSTVYFATAAVVDTSTRTTFSRGDILTESALNGNFDILEAAINDNSDQLSVLTGGTFDYHAFIETSAITSKTFSFTSTDTASSCSTVYWTYTRDIVRTDKTRVRINRDRCGQALTANYYVEDTENYELVQSDISSAGILTPYTFITPIPVLTSTMSVGRSFGGASEATNSSAGITYVSYAIEKFEILGVEPLTLIVNGSSVTYSQCLRIHADRKGPREKTLVSWYCENIGLVKQITAGQSTGFVTGSTLLLTDTNQSAPPVTIP